MDKYEEAIQLIKNARHLVVFTGAGISVDSSIPPFTGPGGLWTKYDPKFIEIGFFYDHPVESWKEIKKIFYDFMLDSCKPNLSHKTIGDWSKKGIVKEVITQNIDNLHQVGGAKVVHEFHGTTKTLTCINCGKKYDASKVSLDKLPPKCSCGGILKPDFVFYGEGINPKVLRASEEAILKADVILIIGTSGQVMPACQLPMIAKYKNKSVKVIEVNPIKSSFTTSITDLYFAMNGVDWFEQINKRWNAKH